MTNEMREFLTELKDLMEKHNVQIESEHDVYVSRPIDNSPTWEDISLSPSASPERVKELLRSWR